MASKRPTAPLFATRVTTRRLNPLRPLGFHAGSAATLDSPLRSLDSSVSRRVARVRVSWPYAATRWTNELSVFSNASRSGSGGIGMRYDSIESHLTYEIVVPTDAVVEWATTSSLKKWRSAKCRKQSFLGLRTKVVVRVMPSKNAKPTLWNYGRIEPNRTSPLRKAVLLILTA